MARTARKSRKSARRSKACRGKRKSRARWTSKRCRRTGSKRTSYRSKARKGRGRSKSRRRNPSGMERTLRDGTTLSLHESGNNGIIYIHHANGQMDDISLPWSKAVAKFRAYKSGKKYSRRASRSTWRELAMDNPRRGRKTRRNCGMTQDPRYATTRIIRKGSKYNPRKTYRPRGRNKWTYSNPAAFPMPFVSAMNPRISRKEARGMGRVLRRHGYKRCRV